MRRISFLFWRVYTGSLLSYFIVKGCERNISKSVGKVFEENWKKSVPGNIWIYRPPDAAQSFNQSSNLRFSQKSPCDYMMFDGYHFFCLELKSVAGKSISFEKEKKDKGVIHLHQIEYLKSCMDYTNMVSGLIVDFRGTDNTWFLNIKEWDNLINSISKKSFNESDLISYSHPILISKKKLKVNYKYDIDKFIHDSILLEVDNDI